MFRKMVVVAIGILVLLKACSTTPVTESKTLGDRTYFPLDIGREWTYHITLADASGYNALFFWEVRWDTNKRDGQLLQVPTRGRHIVEKEDQRADGVYVLTFRIKGLDRASQHIGHLQGYIVEVVRDDLNIYQHATKTLFVVSDANPYTVQQIRFIDPYVSNMPSPSDWGGPYLPGQAPRILFFIGTEGMRVGRQGSTDRITLEGETMHSGRNALRFRRVVEAYTSDKSEREDMAFLNKSFVEETVLVSGVGMVSLVQKVDGKETMRWTLQE